ncbi:MAG: hypothetical protein SNJ73_01640 [Acetobacteraceae bacterium]
MARRPLQDLRRFALLVGASLALAAAGLATVRAVHGDGPAATDPAFGLVVILLSALSLAGAPLIGVSAGLGLAVLLCALSGVALMIGGTVLLASILPLAFEHAGPGALALILPALAGAAAVPAGLALRLLRRLLAGR